jgi:hypothetical protein
MAMENFLKNLETDGGKILVTVFLLLFIFTALVVMVLTGHPPGEGGKQLASGGVGSLLGILLIYLKPSTK